MSWFKELQFAAAVAMPEEVADDYGTTINGLWAGPHTATEVERLHAKGQRVLFSVPLIALTPEVYEQEEHRHLLDESCRDIFGDASEVDWYYWVSKPVYAACIYSERFRRHLLDICRSAVEAGHDVVNLDEINTSIGLMDRDRGGCGFCFRCLERFRTATGIDDENESVRARLRDDDELYKRYRAFHEEQAYAVALSMIDEIRSWESRCAVTANLAYLGNHVPAMGRLWGAMWGRALDFVMMENSYTLNHGQAHLVLPRGKFVAWYRLASALTDAPTFIVPSILVPKQLAGQERSVYYQLMFLEAYANQGRFAYYWWPGVDHETRLEATAPSQLRDLIGFLKKHRRYFEEAESANDLAVLYIENEPTPHVPYLALAQALAESGYQFDVVYSGDGQLASDSLDDLARYETLLLPGDVTLTDRQREELERYQGRIVRCDGEALTRLWLSGDPTDRNAALTAVADLPRIAVSAPHVTATRYVRGDEVVLQLVNYAYESATDSVVPAESFLLSMPWPTGAEAEAILYRPEGETPLVSRVLDLEFVTEISRLDSYGMLVIRPTDRRARQAGADREMRSSTHCNERTQSAAAPADRPAGLRLSTLVAAPADRRRVGQTRQAAVSPRRKARESEERPGLRASESAAESHRGQRRFAPHAPSASQMRSSLRNGAP